MPTIITVRCFDHSNSLDSSRKFREEMKELDELEMYVRAHITDPKVKRIELKKEIVK